MSDSDKTKTSYVPGEVRASVVAALLAVRRAQTLPTWRVRAAAAEFGVSVRTVWRWLEVAESEDRLGRKSRPCFTVGEDDFVELAYYRGNVSALRAARIAEGRPTPSISAFRDAFARALPPGRRAGLKSGERARRDFDTYLPRPSGRCRNECWEADHTQLAVHVRLPDGRVVMPWATLFLDQSTRVLLGWAVAVTASQESVLAALRSAIDVDAPNGPMGGVPVAIRFDRGKEFLAAAVGLAAASLAIDAKPLPAYTPHLKGAVERVNSSIEQLFLATLPGFVHGARGRDGHLVEDGPLLGLEALVELFAAFVVQYNTVRQHQGLAGRTPLQAWNADATALAVVPPRHLRHLLLARVDRTVTKRGVRLDGRVYNCAELCGLVGERVEVRYLPHHHHEVEVFRGSEHVATAVLVDELAAEDITRLLKHRANEAVWLAKTQRAAAARRRTRFAAMTEPGPLLASTTHTAGGTAIERARHGDVELQRAASRSLVDHGQIPARMTAAGTTRAAGGAKGVTR
jgi:putative transposase